jgi:hypothetical protein
MGLTFAKNHPPLCRTCWRLPSRGALLFALWLAGCNNTCFTFTSNPPTGTIGIARCATASRPGEVARVRMLRVLEEGMKASPDSV